MLLTSLSGSLYECRCGAKPELHLRLESWYEVVCPACGNKTEEQFYQDTICIMEWNSQELGHAMNNIDEKEIK